MKQSSTYITVWAKQKKIVQNVKRKNPWRSFLLILTLSVIRKNSELEKDITEISEKIENFSDHLEEIHSLEVYYGDEDLQSLITHSRGLINDFIDFQASYFDVEVEEADEEED